MDVKVATHIGLVRKRNEDAFWVGKDCFAVCDGMGGHQAGHVAAQLAVKTISAFPFTGKNPQLEVRLAIEAAHKEVSKSSQQDAEYRGMGTTATLACISPGPQGVTLVVGHVGDSRGYLFFNGELSQITTDHSVVAELIRAGSVSPKEARSHARRHMLTQALGVGEIEIELITRELQRQAVVLLCTDGLTDVVSDEQIGQILAKQEYRQNSAQELVNLANSLGGPDNITVIVAQVG